jgi:hypothetical protein
MLPRRWLQLEAMPKNTNGKIDLTAIGRLFADG